jgi:hypothetical protein
VGQGSSIGVVFATDENYFHLASDLVNSLIENVLPHRQVAMYCLDIGLSLPSRQWMLERGVQLRTATPDRLPESLRPIVAAKPYMIAQFYRPYWPELAPEVDIIIHIDCDAWCQNAGLIAACEEAVEGLPQNFVLAPSTSHYSGGFFENLEKIIEMQQNWTFGCYEKGVADALARMAFLSSGVFAGRRDAPVWDRWAAEIARIVPLVAAVNPPVLHLAEQTALNGVVRIAGLVTILDPIYNFHCNSGGVRRCEVTGKVMTSLIHPNVEIGVVHLADWNRRQDDYTASGLRFSSREPARALVA